MYVCNTLYILQYMTSNIKRIYANQLTFMSPEIIRELKFFDDFKGNRS